MELLDLGVDPGAADELIGARTADERVLATPTVERGAAARPEEHIGATVAVQPVTAAAADDHAVAPEPADDVGLTGADLADAPVSAASAPLDATLQEVWGLHATAPPRVGDHG